MPARPMTYAEIGTEINSNSNSKVTGQSTWTTIRAAIIRDRLAYISKYMPYRRRVQFQVEGRYGSATSTSSNNLVDATKVQFASTDVGKVVLNTTDNTWAVIASYSSTSQVGLTKDIMASGEQYKLCNKFCRNQNQIYIGDVTDFRSISQDDGVYYRGLYRNHKLLEQDKVLEIIVDFSPDDTNLAYADKYVDIIFDCYHRISQLTDLAGTVSGTPAAGAVTLTTADFTGTEVIEEGTLFEITKITSLVNRRETYCTTTSTTLTGGGGAIYFYPGLDTTCASGDVITVIGSTLDNILEPILIRACVADAILRYSATRIEEMNINPNVVENYMKIWQNELSLVDRDLIGMASCKSVPKHSRGT